MDIKGKKINFLGDSIIEGCGTTGKDKRITERIAANYGAICRNYGLGGTRIARQTVPSEPDWFDRDFCMRAEEMDRDADAVIVFGGTNDFGHGDAPMGKMTDRTPYTFYGALHILYSGLIEKYPESQIMVITPTHRCNEDSVTGDGNKPDHSGTLRDYVCAIREVAEFYSIPVLDLFASGSLQPRVPVIKEKYMPDGLHPNDAGNAIISEKIARFLENL